MSTVRDIFDSLTIIEDFPKKGIPFRHIGPLLKQPHLFEAAIWELMDLTDFAPNKPYDVVCGLDARGFIIATMIQQMYKLPQVMLRKGGKLPGEVFTAEYTKEYGVDTLEIEKGALEPNQNVLIVDDLMATGGSMLAAIELVQKTGAKVSTVMVLVELSEFKARQKIKELHPEVYVISLFSIDSNNKYISHNAF